MSIYSADSAVGFGDVNSRDFRVEERGEVPGTWAAKLLLLAVSRGPPGSVRRSLPCESLTIQMYDKKNSLGRLRFPSGSIEIAKMDLCRGPLR